MRRNDVYPEEVSVGHFINKLPRILEREIRPIAHGCVARLSREHAPQALKIKIFVNSAAEAGVLMQWLGQIPDDVQTVPAEHRFRKDVVILLEASVQVVRVRISEEGTRM